MLDPAVSLSLLHVPGPDEIDEHSINPGASLTLDQERARKLGREVDSYELRGPLGSEAVRLARENTFDLIVAVATLAESTAGHTDKGQGDDEGTFEFIVQHAPCPVCVIHLPAIPRHVDETDASQSHE
jgi:nucleotide-binding universal stress UspA family protein